MKRTNSIAIALGALMLGGATNALTPATANGQPVDQETAWNNFKKYDLEQAYNLIKDVNDACGKQSGLLAQNTKPKLDLAINFLKRGVADRYPEINNVISQIGSVDSKTKTLDGIYYCENVRQILGPQMTTLHNTWMNVRKALDNHELQSKLSDAQKLIDQNKSDSDKIVRYQQSTSLYLHQQQKYQRELDQLKQQHAKDLESKNACTAATSAGSGSGLTSVSKSDGNTSGLADSTTNVTAGSAGGGTK